MAAGKCPHCGGLVRHLNLNSLDVRKGNRKLVGGVTFACGSCDVVLSAWFDPGFNKDVVVRAMKDN